jgi:hypothetical protein
MVKSNGINHLQPTEFFTHLSTASLNKNSQRKTVQFKTEPKQNEIEDIANTRNGHVLLKSRSDGLDYPPSSAPVEFILKKPNQTVNYMQQTCIRYLRPTTPDTPPGDIIIRQLADEAGPSLPPLIIRQQQTGIGSNKSMSTQEKLIIREAPPQLPASLFANAEKQIIMIQKKSNDQTTVSSQQNKTAPQRKLIIYRQAPVAQKPPPIIVERWLPYGKIKRKVIFQKADGTSVTTTTVHTDTTSPTSTSHTNMNETKMRNKLSPVRMTTTDNNCDIEDSDSEFTSLLKRIFSFIDKTDRGYIPLKEATVLFERFKDRLNMHEEKDQSKETRQQKKSQRSVSDIIREMPNFKNEKKGIVSFNEFKSCFLNYYKSEQN